MARLRFNLGSLSQGYCRFRVSVKAKVRARARVSQGEGQGEGQAQGHKIRVRARVGMGAELELWQGDVQRPVRCSPRSERGGRRRPFLRSKRSKVVFRSESI